ncbi:site-specific integrase [Bdellovibrionota bacterium FG-1]
MNDPFNPKIYRGKALVYITVRGNPGIATIWDWNQEKRKYLQRSEGLRYYGYKKVGGKQESKCFERFDDAKAWRNSSFVFNDNQSHTGMNFADARRKYFERAKGRLEVTTYETYESCTKHLGFFDRVQVAEITPKVIDAWLDAIKKPDYLALQHKSRMTYHAELSLLRQILVHYSEYEDDSYQLPLKKRHLEDAIVDHGRYRQSLDRNRHHFIPRKDFEAFLDEMARRAQGDPSRRVFYIVAEFQLGGGPRIGEACAIRFEDILDWDTGAVSISRSVQWSRKKGRATQISPLTKTGESRVVFLSSRALGVLRKWAAGCGRSKGLVFSPDGLNPIPYRSVQYHYQAAFRKLGMSWKSTHILRHSYSTDFLERTGNKAALQGQLGHRTSRQTDHYAKITATTQQAGVRAYNESLHGSNVVELFPVNQDSNRGALGDGWVKTKSPQNQ